MLFITNNNFAYYSNRSNPEVEEFGWTVYTHRLTSSFLRKFPSLRTLVVWINHKDDLEALEGCPQLHKLDCRRRTVVSLTGLRFCPNLRELDCAGNIESLKGIENCPLLERLACKCMRDYDRDDEPDILPSSITDLEEPRSLPSLRELTVYYQSFSNLEWLQSYPNLVMLEIKSHEIESLHGLGFCPKLENLSCMSGPLSSLDGIENCPRLKVLKCPSNNLTSLLPIAACSLLEDLDCKYNELESLQPLTSCPLLLNVDCSHCELTTLDGIEICTHLESFACSDNELMSLQQLSNCSRLKSLVCTCNQLASLDLISNCTELVYLDCAYNILTDIRFSRTLVNLQDLMCQGNRLESISGIEGCRGLRSLICFENMIEAYDPIVYLRALDRILPDAILPGSQTVQVHRYFDRAPRAARKSTIYEDNQNVHDHRIQQTVCASIQNLLADPEPTFSMDSVIASGMNETAIRLLAEYCDDETVHSIQLLTYTELLAYVWQRIERSEHKAELVKILGDQILDSNCKCFTGRFNRTLSVLVGFYDDIVIAISDNSRIGAIIIAAGARLEVYNHIAHRELAQTLLIEAGYDTSTIEPWLGAISEP